MITIGKPERRQLDNSCPGWSPYEEPCFWIDEKDDEPIWLDNFLNTCDMEEFEDWDGYLAQTYSSGILVRFIHNEPDMIEFAPYVVTGEERD